MDEHAVQHYLDQVPVEIREAIMELDTPQKWAIYIALTVDGDKYFNQLKKQFKANPNTIDKALKSLVAGGLVAKKVKQLADIGDTNKTYYTSTTLGEKLMTGLDEVALPPRAMQPVAAPVTRSRSRASRVEET
jgi:DNA-binding HxlR family transcriptional regulator